MPKEPAAKPPAQKNPAKKKAAAKSAADSAEKVGFRERTRQIVTAFKLTRERDPKLVPYLVLSFVVAVGVVEGIAVALGHPYLLIFPAVMVGILSVMMVFGKRAQTAAMLQAEGKPGAAVWVLQNMRGNWKTTEGVAGNAQMDLVHRVVGKPGVVLIGEGAPQRVRSLLAQEKKRVARISGDTPIYDIIVGQGEGEVPLKKLSSYLLKLPPNIRDAIEINNLDKRLQALSTPRAAMPKGPIPQRAQRGISQRTIRRH